jgi:hypothetical protein
MSDSPNASAQGSSFGISSLILLAVGLIVLYFLYRALYGSENIEFVTLVKDETNAAPADAKLPQLPQPQEGGEYTFNTWVYINSFNKNFNRRKHIFELQGPAFSTLLVGLGAFKNSLIVRTHTRDPLATSTAQGFRSGSNAENMITEGYQNATQGSNLTKTVVSDLFKEMATGESSVDAPPVCDLPEVDLQRWVMITVVLNGRTIDVYMDGKLTRSCVTSSYYKVDSTGPIKPIILDRGGFDGYISGMSVANYSLNPGEIYRLYSAGPKAQQDVWSWLLGLLQGATAQ